MKTKENKGVTLVALAVTIIIMLILAGVTISTLTGNSGISSNANQARIQNELAQYKEQMELYLAEKKVENYDFFIESLNAGKESLIYDGKPDDEKGNIKTIIPNIADEYIECLQIINGELYIKTKDEKKIKAAQQLGIQVNPFDITDDGELLSTKANLKLINGEGTLALPSLVSKIGMGAFSGVEGLKTIIIPSSVKEIGDYAFSYNKEIERVVIEGDLKRIGHYAFDQATNLREINLPNSISEIGIFAFRNTQISEVTVPKNVQTISFLTFGNCSKLKKIVLQEGLKTIEGNAIGGPVESISLPSTVTSINAQAFIDCYNLINIDVSKNNNFIFESGKLYNKNRTEIVFITKKALANQNVIEINDGVEYFNTDISSYSGIKKLVIPSSLKSISAKILPSAIENIEVKSGNTDFISENGILYNKNNGQLIVCYSKNTNVTIQEGIKSISSYAFKLSSGIKELTFPKSLETISGHSLDYMYSIQNINMGKNVKSIDPLFRPGNYSGNINIDSQNPYYVVENKILYKKNNGKKDTLVSVLYKIDGTIELDSKVKTIGYYSFYGQSGLKELVIPEGIEKIEASAFTNCPSLLKIEIPKTVKSIGDSCFSDNTSSLEEILIKNKEDSITGAPWGAAKGMKVVQWEK